MTDSRAYPIQVTQQAAECGGPQMQTQQTAGECRGVAAVIDWGGRRRRTQASPGKAGSRRSLVGGSSPGRSRKEGRRSRQARKVVVGGRLMLGWCR